MMSYTCQMSGSGGGSPPDLDKFFIPKNITEDYLTQKIELLNENFLKQQMKSSLKIFENFDYIYEFKKVDTVSQEVIEERLEKWVAKDKIEVEAIQENSIKTSQLFIMANLNCKENEISVPCLPQDLLKQILIIKTIAEKQDAIERIATFQKRKKDHESFCGNPLYVSFEKAQENIDLFSDPLPKSNILDLIVEKLFPDPIDYVEPEANDSCQIQ